MSSTTDPQLAAVEQIVEEAYQRSAEKASAPVIPAVTESISRAVVAMLRRETRELQRLTDYYHGVLTQIQHLVIPGYQHAV